MVKYAPRKVYIRRVAAMWNYPTRSSAVAESDQPYMDKLFIPIQG